MLRVENRSATPVRKVTLDPFDAATARSFSAARKAVRAMLEALPDAVDEGQLEEGVRRKGVAGADHAAGALDPEALFAHAVPLAEIATKVLSRAGTDEANGGRAVSKAREPDVTLSFSFDLTNPAVERWAEARAAQLVVELSDATRATIRSLVLRAVTEGGHPYSLARAIRPLIGLHERWATAVLNYRFGLDAKGLPSDRVEQLTARYYSSLLKTRSETIARTEVLSAANAGKLEAWNQAFASGLFGGEQPEVEWVAADDAEPYCADLDGTTVPLGDVFSSELGDVEGPPLHPNCRCTVVVVTPSGAEIIAGDAGE